MAIDNSIFTGNRYETWKFEKLSLINSEYVHNGWITNYVNNEESSFSLDFSRKIITNCNLKIDDSITFDYLSDLIKIYYCLDTYEFPLGLYLPLTCPRQLTDENYVERKILGYGLLRTLVNNKVTTSYTISAGTNVVTEIRNLIESIGSWVTHNIEDCDEILPSDKSYIIGTSKLDIINSLLEMINYYPLWASGNGVFRSIPWSKTENIVYTFEDNEVSIYSSNVYEEKNYTSSFNRVLVIANELSETASLYKSWSMEDEGIEDNSFSYSNIGRYEDKIIYSEATSQTYVDLRARKEIRKALEVDEPIILPHSFVTSRENDGLPYAGDCYRFKCEALGKDEIYKIEKMEWTFDIEKDVISTIRRVTA